MDYSYKGNHKKVLGKNLVDNIKMNSYFDLYENINVYSLIIIFEKIIVKCIYFISIYH